MLRRALQLAAHWIVAGELIKSVTVRYDRVRLVVQPAGAVAPPSYGTRFIAMLEFSDDDVKVCIECFGFFVYMNRGVMQTL